MILSTYYPEDEAEKWIINNGKKHQNVDNLNSIEQQSLEKIIYCLSIINSCEPIEIINPEVHATLKKDMKIIDFIIISNGSHEKCFEYAKNLYSPSGLRFVIIITYDNKNLSLDDKIHKKIYEIQDVDTAEVSQFNVGILIFLGIRVPLIITASDFVDVD